MHKKRNYRTASRAGSVVRQSEILLLLEVGEGLTVKEIGDMLGMSRQLALYHLKKLAASRQLVMVLEPCEQNGLLQFRVWNEMALVRHYSSRQDFRVAA